MTTDVVAYRPDAQPRQLPTIAVLGGKEAWRILSSPAIPILGAYLLLVMGVDLITGGDDGPGLTGRAPLADLTAFVALLFWGPITFVATHLVATSARRTGSERLLAATPTDRRRRDLALCLGVLMGPVVVAVFLAMFSAWLADGVEFTVDMADVNWSWLDIAQVGAITLGAGVLAVVVARWIPFPGVLLLSFVGLVIGTGWLTSSGGGRAIRPWFAPYVLIDWWSDEVWHAAASPVWHLVYLLMLSALGVCAVALRQPDGRRGWLAISCGPAIAVLVAGWLQLPPIR